MITPKIYFISITSRERTNSTLGLGKDTPNEVIDKEPTSP